MTMKLIGSTSSSFVRKVRVVLSEKKLDYQWVLENPWANDSPLSEINPLGKVPCLVMEGGEVFFDSRVIVEYVDTLSPVGKLIPASGRDRAEVKTWEALADGIIDAASAVRLELTWAGRLPEERSAEWINRQMNKVHAGLKVMETQLGDKAHCCGANLTLADLAVGCTLGWLTFRFPDLDWRSEHSNLARLYDKLMQRQSFIETMPA